MSKNKIDNTFTVVVPNDCMETETPKAYLIKDFPEKGSVIWLPKSLVKSVLSNHGNTFLKIPEWLIVDKELESYIIDGVLHTTKETIYVCGWCGGVCDSGGFAIDPESNYYKETVDILKKHPLLYSDSIPTKTHILQRVEGNCCSY